MFLLLLFDSDKTDSFGSSSGKSFYYLADAEISHAKPRVVANAKQSITTIGLDGVLYFLGFKDSYLGDQGKL